MNEHYIGSDFDDFLTEEGLLEHCQAVAVKRVLAYKLEQFMTENKMSKTEMAKGMGNFNRHSITLCLSCNA